MPKRLRIAIVGYGTAGQAIALFLSRQGHALTVFEQASEPGPVGAGFLLQPTGLDVLDALGLRAQILARGQRIDRLYGCNVRGRRVMDMRYADHANDCHGVGLTRGSLFEVLRDAYPDAARILTGTRIESIAGNDDALRDAAGRLHGPYDLIVAADGAHSRLRQHAHRPIQRDRLYPWGALWCLLRADEWPFAHELQQRYVGTREMIGLLPVGQRVGHEGRWLTFYFSAPGDQVDTFDEQAMLRLRERVAVIWPEVATLLTQVALAAHMQRARYRDVVLANPRHGRVLFIGDAAHAMSPQLGQGVNMALLDARALAEAVAGNDLGPALDAYYRERRHHLAVYQRMSRWLTPVFQSRHDILGWLRDSIFGPLSRLPLARGEMLKILTGTKRAWWR